MMALAIAGVIYMRQRAGETREHKWSFANSPQVALITSFIFLIVLIGGIVSFYYVGKMYVADMHYRNAQEKLLAQDFVGAANESMAAARLNGDRAVYHRGAAQAFMATANQEAVKEEPDVNIVSNNVGLAIDAGRTGVTVEPVNVVSYEFLGGLYQNAGLYVRGVDQWVIDAYNKAIELDPNNPVLWNNLGKAYVIKSDRILLAAVQDKPQRCLACYRLRLQATARYAAGHNFEAFTTTLLSSPHQDIEAIREIGKQQAVKNKVQFFTPEYGRKRYKGFRPLFTTSRRLAKKAHLYEQTYCGCAASQQEQPEPFAKILGNR